MARRLPGASVELSHNRHRIDACRMARPVYGRIPYHPGMALANYGRTGGRSGRSENCQHPSSNSSEVEPLVERRVRLADRMPYGRTIHASCIGQLAEPENAHPWGAQPSNHLPTPGLALWQKRRGTILIGTREISFRDSTDGFIKTFAYGIDGPIDPSRNCSRPSSESSRLPGGGCTMPVCDGS